MTYRTYDIEKSPLYRMRNRRKLAILLKLPEGYFKKSHQYFYRVYPIQKSDGKGYRIINEPSESLKRIQKRLCQLFMRIETPAWLMSGKKNCNNLANAVVHKDNRYVVTMDIRHFYDSADRCYIYNMFKRLFCMEDDICCILTNLLTNNTAIPTGGPASQIVLFWAYKSMFDRINDLAQKHDCTFSLYVDDMTFSSNNPIPNNVELGVCEILKKYGLSVKHEKTCVYKPDDVKVITGVGMRDGRLLVPNKTRNKIIEQYQKCVATEEISDIRKLNGMLNVARQIEPNIFPMINRYLSGCQEEIRQPLKS